jgi:hypothetical protein
MGATSNTVTIVGIIFPASMAAIAATAVAVYAGRREDARMRSQERRENARLRSQERGERLQELGKVLDECGAAVTQALAAFDRRRVSPESKLSETGEDFDKKVESVRLMDNRVALRLGTSDPAYQSYRAAGAGLQELSDLIWEAQGYLKKEQDPTANKLRADVKSAHEEFLAAARRWVDAENLRAQSAEENDES